MTKRIAPRKRRAELTCDNCGKRGIVENNTCGYCHKGYFVMTSERKRLE